VTARGLLALWGLQNVIDPPQPGEADAVASLRLLQVARLPSGERDRLSRLMWGPDQPADGGKDRRQEGPPWQH
jgi:hypothetical protein